ncbi:MAG: CoA transferase [Desulfobacterales bacterium]|nr:CoA transferase [Desulfobacterales bacterium]
MIPKGALSGVTVLDLSRLLPGPYCSMILADHGARVIAIEDRKQYAADGLFLPNVCRNKEHMTLDLKSVTGKEIFFKMVETADVILEGFRPGVVDRLGVGYEAVRQVKSDIIYCSVTGYGQTGAFRDRVGHDINYLGYAGVLNMIGEADRPPSIPGVQIADMAGGGMNAAIGILLALVSRGKTGQGQVVDISMTDSMVGLLPVAMYWKSLMGQTPARGDNMLSHRYACYNTYETADGRHMAVGAVEGKFWKAICERLELARYASAQYDDAKRKEIIKAFRETFRKKTMAQWETELADLDLCVSGIRTADEAADFPLFREREMFIEAPGASGKDETTIGVPVKLSRTPGSVQNASVQFGQDTEKILTELGYKAEEIACFAENGIT